MKKTSSLTYTKRGKGKIRKTLIIAHRGASRMARENTMEAFRKAIKVGAEMIELDVQRSKDGVLVISHDSELARKTINKTNYPELKRLAKKRKFHLPTLKEVLVLVKNKIKLDIEIKKTGYELEVAKLATALLPTRDFIITSFNPLSIVLVKKNYPKITTGLLLDHYWWGKHLDKAFTTKNLLAHCDFILPHVTRIGAALSSPKFRNKPFYTWTVDKKKDIINCLKDPRIFGIITNVPDLAIKLRRDL